MESAYTLEDHTNSLLRAHAPNYSVAGLTSSNSVSPPMVSFLSSSSLEREEYGVSRIPHRADPRQRLHTGCLYVQHCDMTATRARDKQTFNSSAHRSTTAGSRSKCGVNK